MTILMTNEQKRMIASILSSNHFFSLATSNIVGKVDSAIVYYDVDQDFNFFILTKSDSTKCKNMLQNKYVAFSMTDNSGVYSLQVHGESTQIKKKDRLTVFKRIIKRVEQGGYSWPSPIAMLDLGEVIACKITPTSVKLGHYESPLDAGLYHLLSEQK